MPAPESGSYFSRFFLKFVEIIAAGLATAVSGYLIAHLTGVLSSPGPAPAAVNQVAPSASTNPPAQEIAPNASTSSAPIPVNANDQRVNPQRELNGSVTQPARKSLNATKPELARKHIDSAAGTAASPPDQSFVSQVRAALTNVDANRTDSLEVSPHQPPAIAQPQSGTNAHSTVAPVAAPPRQQSPVEFNPPVPVEIKSRPAVDAQPAPATSVGQDSAVLSPLEQILRQDPLAGTEQAPRPPLPVGQ
jgi:hypothetical protein